MEKTFEKARSMHEEAERTHFTKEEAIENVNLAKLRENTAHIMNALEGISKKLDGVSGRGSSGSSGSSNVDLGEVYRKFDGLTYAIDDDLSFITFYRCNICSEKVDRLTRELDIVSEMIRNMAMAVAHQGTPEGGHDREVLERQIQQLASKIDTVRVRL